MTERPAHAAEARGEQPEAVELASAQSNEGLQPKKAATVEEHAKTDTRSGAATPLERRQALTSLVAELQILREAMAQDD